MNDLRTIGSDLLTLRDKDLSNNLLYSNQSYDEKTNQIILIHVIRCIILKIHKDLMNLFLIRPKLFLTSCTFDSVSHFNTHKLQDTFLPSVSFLPEKIVNNIYAYMDVFF